MFVSVTYEPSVSIILNSFFHGLITWYIYKTLSLVQWTTVIFCQKIFFLYHQSGLKITTTVSVVVPPLETKNETTTANNTLSVPDSFDSTHSPSSGCSTLIEAILGKGAMSGYNNKSNMENVNSLSDVINKHIHGLPLNITT